jgi:hypothetical protein
VYPISRGRFINFVATEYHPDEAGTHLGGPWVTEVNPSDVQSLFHGWEKEVGELVQVSAARRNTTHFHQSVDTVCSV